ncbi:MAG TPA: hypothetical protein VGI64_11595 [Streptosporangiaceae bacterium]
MSTTEERLRHAYQVAAETVSPEPVLRRLSISSVNDGTDPGRRASGAQTSRLKRVVVPLAAAAAVTGVLTGSVLHGRALEGGAPASPRSAHGAGFPVAGQAPGGTRLAPGAGLVPGQLPAATPSPQASPCGVAPQPTMPSRINAPIRQVAALLVTSSPAVVLAASCVQGRPESGSPVPRQA